MARPKSVAKQKVSKKFEKPEENLGIIKLIKKTKINQNDLEVFTDLAFSRNNCTRECPPKTITGECTSKDLIETVDNSHLSTPIQKNKMKRTKEPNNVPNRKIFLRKRSKISNPHDSLEPALIFEECEVLTNTDVFSSCVESHETSFDKNIRKQNRSPDEIDLFNNTRLSININEIKSPETTLSADEINDDFNLEINNLENSLLHESNLDQNINGSGLAKDQSSLCSVDRLGATFSPSHRKEIQQPEILEENENSTKINEYVDEMVSQKSPVISQTISIRSDASNLIGKFKKRVELQGQQLIDKFLKNVNDTEKKIANEEAKNIFKTANVAIQQVDDFMEEMIKDKKTIKLKMNEIQNLISNTCHMIQSSINNLQSVVDNNDCNGENSTEYLMEFKRELKEIYKSLAEKTWEDSIKDFSQQITTVFKNNYSLNIGDLRKRNDNDI